MSGHLRIYAQLRGYGVRGPRYQVRMNKPDGMVIVDATTEPLFAAARVLLSKGVTGKLQLWDNVRPYCRLQGDIERLAGMTVSEGDRGICLRPYTERTTSGEFDGEATEDAPGQIGRPGGAPRASVTIHIHDLAGGAA